MDRPIMALCPVTPPRTVTRGMQQRHISS